MMRTIAGCSIVLAANTVREQPMETLAGIAIVLLGLPVYYSMKRRQPKVR